MNHRLIIALFASSTLFLGACGAADMTEDGSPASEEAEVVESTDQAVTDPVPGLRETVWAPHVGSLGHYEGQCQTSYKDGNHRLQVLCQIQEFWGGAWHADVSGWKSDEGVANGLGLLVTRGCTPGLTYTLRTVGRGRVLLGSAWSPTKQAISSTVKLICPRG